MPIYTFSAKASKPADIKLIETIKTRCDEQGQNFSALIIKLLRDHEDGRKVQDRK